MDEHTALLTSLKVSLVDKADRKLMEQATVKLTELNAAIESSRSQTLSGIARTDALAIELINFRKESQNGIINATKAANEARAAVNAALASLQNIEPPATVASVTALQDELTTVRNDIANIRLNISTKADIQEVNDALEEKASKTLVAAALHKKLSLSKVSDTLQPVQNKLIDLEKQFAISSEKLITLTNRMESYINTNTETTNSWLTNNNKTQTQLQNQHQQDKSSLQLSMNTLESRINDVENIVGRMQERTTDTQTDLQYVRNLSHTDLNKLREDYSLLRQEINALSTKLSTVSAVQLNDRTNQTITATADTVTNTAKLLITPLEEQMNNLVKEVENINKLLVNVEKQRTEPAIVPELSNRSLDASFSSVRTNILPPGGSASTFNNTSSVNQRLKLELEATRNDLRTVAGEVQGIIDLLDIGSISISTTPKTSKKEKKTKEETKETKDDSTNKDEKQESTEDTSESNGTIKVSAATAAQALRSAVAHLTERMANAEHDITDIRTRCINTEERLLEETDTVLQHSALIQSLDAETQILQQRMDSVELTTVFSNPTRPLPVSRSAEGISRFYVTPGIPNTTSIYPYPNSLVSTEPVYPTEYNTVNVPTSTTIPSSYSRIGPMHSVPVSTRIAHALPHTNNSTIKAELFSPVNLSSPPSTSTTKAKGNPNPRSSTAAVNPPNSTTGSKVTTYATNRYHQAKLQVPLKPINHGIGGHNLNHQLPQHKDTLLHVHTHKEPSPTPDHRWEE